MNSRHLTGHAVDLVPLMDLDANGKIETAEMFNIPLMRRLNHHIARAFEIEGVPFEWGGDWGWDFPHYELHRSHYRA